MGLFGRTDHEAESKKRMNEWCSKLRSEGRVLDRQIRRIGREEEKAKRTLKEAAKKNDREACLIMAKELVHTRKAVSRIYASKAHINSVVMQMRNQYATQRLAGSIQKSTEVMKSMQRLVRIPEIMATMRELSKEMTKAGIMEEMLEDTMESLDEDPEELEEQAAKEVDQILFDLTNGQLGRAPAAPTETIGAPSVPAEKAAATPDTDLRDLEAQLEALRS